MKAQVEVLLSMWGRWAIKRASGSLGYPAISPMFNGAPKGDSYGSSAPLGIGEPELLMVDAAINRLPSALRLAVIEAYQRGGSLREVGRRMGVSDKTVGKYLSEAHLQISVDMENQFPHNRANSDSFEKCHRKPATA